MEKIESVVLGCTHFLYLREAIEDFFTHGIEIFDGHSGTVNYVRQTLEALDILAQEGSGGYSILNSKSLAMKHQSQELFERYLNLKR